MKWSSLLATGGLCIALACMTQAGMAQTPSTHAQAGTSPAASSTQPAPRTARGQAVYRIVERWGAHVQEAYGADVRRWAREMVPVFAAAPLERLQQAARARSFTAMNDALLVPARPAADAAPPEVRAGNERIKARSLGDPAQDLVYVPVTPCRILDTRVVGGPIGADSFRDFDITDVVRFSGQGGDTSNCNIGDKGSFAAAALNITVVTPNVAGYITVFPYLSSRPTAATMNYVAGDVRNSLAIVRLDQSASTYEFSVYSYAQTHLVADVVGYFREPEATALECVTLISPVINSPGAVTFSINSPICPLGYTAVSGGCRSENIAGNWGYSIGGYTTETEHVCQFYAPAGGRPFTARIRCCRTAGI
jgi:hypothetical protein